jgi:putative nucleotidyltransferase with HDIG domain
LAIASPPLSGGSSDALANPAGRHNEGHGRRLTMAFEALESYPVLVESRNRVLRLFENGRPSISDVVAAVEADLALTVTVVRLANQLEGPTRGRIDSVVGGVEALSIDTIHAIASRARTFDFFERTAVWQGIPERLRLHAIATQRAADRLGRETGYDNRDRLMVTSLLHDIGKLVLVHAYPGYPEQVHGDAKTPEDRLRAERRELGVDHSLVGGVLARRWGLPRSIASVIERHHAEDAADEAAIVRLADMLAHYMMGDTISSSEILAASRTVELSPTSLRTVMYELPLPTVGTRPRQVEPCPMSAREIDVLSLLAQGMVYKKIASE